VLASNTHLGLASLLDEGILRQTHPRHASRQQIRRQRGAKCALQQHVLANSDYKTTNLILSAVSLTGVSGVFILLASALVLAFVYQVVDLVVDWYQRVDAEHNKVWADVDQVSSVVSGRSGGTSARGGTRVAQAAAPGLPAGRRQPEPRGRDTVKPSPPEPQQLVSARSKPVYASVAVAEPLGARPFKRGKTSASDADTASSYSIGYDVGVKLPGSDLGPRPRVVRVKPKHTKAVVFTSTVPRHPPEPQHTDQLSESERSDNT